MQKKVLVGIGIGCGGLILLALIAVGVAGYWAKKTLGGAVEAGQQIAAQEKDLKELNQSYAFTPPEGGQVLALQEARLNDYLAIREAALPLFKDFEQKTESLQKKADEGGQASITEGLQAGSMFAQLLSQTRSIYIEQLKKHRMSPREFHAITTAIYASTFNETVGQVDEALASQREEVEKALADLQVQLEDPNLSEEERASLQEQQSALQTQIEAVNDAAQGSAGLPQLDEKNQGVARANVALLEKFKERVQSAYNPAFDSLIITDDMRSDFGALGQQRQDE